MDYADRNRKSLPIGFRINRELWLRFDAACTKAGMSKSTVYSRLIAAYLDGRLGTHQTDLPLPPPTTKDDIMAAAKKSKVAVKAKAAPAAKAKMTAAKKK